MAILVTKILQLSCVQDLRNFAEKWYEKGGYTVINMFTFFYDLTNPGRLTRTDDYAC